MIMQASPLAKPTSIILVEYPKRLAHQIPDTLCGLQKVAHQIYVYQFSKTEASRSCLSLEMSPFAAQSTNDMWHSLQFEFLIVYSRRHCRC